MALPDILLFIAGVVGMIVGIIHTLVMRRVIIRPIQMAVDHHATMRVGAKRLVAPLLYVSGLTWFVEGAALVAAAMFVHGPGRLLICAVAAISYGYAAALNAWATRGRHFGWALMALAVLLVVGSTGLTLIEAPTR